MKQHTIQIATALALLAASAVNAQQTVQWKVSDGGNGHWYGTTSLSSNWFAVRDWCVARNGHLATFTSQQEWQWAKASLPVVESFVGAFQDHSDPEFSEPFGGWKWVNGEPFDLTDYMTVDDCPGGNEGSCGCVGDGNQDVLFFTGCCSSVLDDVGDGIVTNCDSNSRNGVIEWSADCNGDGIVDYGQCYDGTLADYNGNNIPDICEGPDCHDADLTINGVVDGADLGALLAFWGPINQAFPRADINRDGVVNGADLGRLLAAWGACPVIPTWASLVEAAPDPSVITDANIRAAIVATGMAWRVRDAATQMEMLLVPPGNFTMGCTASEQSSCGPSEIPTHTVTLTSAFYIGRYEVTQAQWHAKMGSNPSYFRNYPDSAIRPVEQLSWNTVQGYIANTNMRLPTEAEWEYACRAGTTTAYSNGSNDDNTVGTIAWYYANSELQTHAVGSKAANALGLHDMLGNVFEWVSDRYETYPATPQINPQGANGGSYVVWRGGGWGSSTVRSSIRAYDGPNIQYFGEGGFRVARNP
jgi:formylglycine-generating enzyme required for sulfatase activity